MNKNNILKFVFVSILCIVSFTFLDAAFQRTIEIGNYWTTVIDNTEHGEGSLWETGRMAENAHFAWPIAQSQYEGYYLGVREWTDTTGKTVPYMLTGASPVGVNEEVTIPIQNEETGNFIDRYYRGTPPSRIVDGVQLQHPKLNGDHYNAGDQIPGDADVMVTSKIRTHMGVDVTQRVLAYDESEYDDFVIFEFTFKNTGNVDRDDEVELPDQVLEDFYYLRTSRLDQWNTEYFFSARGEFEDDDIRVHYAYPGRRNALDGIDWTGNSWEGGNFYRPDENVTYLTNAHSVGTAVLHASESTDNPDVDDMSQPAMTAAEGPDYLWLRNDPSGLGENDRMKNYRVMSEGFDWHQYELPRKITPEVKAELYPDKGPVRQPNNHYARIEDEAAAHNYAYTSDFDCFTFSLAYFFACGPYTLEPGEEIKVTFANSYGVIDPIKNWEISKKWLEGTIEPPPGYSWDNPDEAMPPPYQARPDLYNNNRADWAKDAWVFTGIDSMFKHFYSAQEVEENDYKLPAGKEAPLAPHLEVTSLPDKIELKWTPQELADPVEAYRIYRTTTSVYENYILWSNSTDHGEWKRIAEVDGEQTSYNDSEVTRGVGHYYYVTAVDENGNESGKWRNMASQPASLTRPPSEKGLDDIRIVPNPYNIAAEEVQYTGQQDKLMFLNLPNECTIKIYTEAGDLVRTIEHSGSGDEPWGQRANDFLTSDDGQIVVSGIYIAYFETPDGKSTYKKFVIVR